MQKSLDELARAGLEPRLVHTEENVRQLPISKTEGVGLLVGFLEWLRGSNAERLPQNGVFDDQVEAALAEVPKSGPFAALLRNEIKAIALIVGDAEVRMFDSYHVTAWYADFLQRLKEGAAEEKQALLAVAAKDKTVWPPNDMVG